MVRCCLKKMGIFSFSSPCSLKARNTPNKEGNHPLPTSTRSPKAFLSGPFPPETQCLFSSLQFSHLVKSDSVTPWSAARQASLSITNSRSLLKLMSIESVMPSNHLILCCPLLLLTSIFPIISVFSMNQFFASAGQSIGASASAPVLLLQNQAPHSELENSGLLCLRAQRS